jgi:hypothetical protein
MGPASRFDDGLSQDSLQSTNSMIDISAASPGL